MLLQVTQHRVERAVGPVRHASAPEIGCQRILGEYDVGDQRGAHVRQSVAYEDAGPAYDHSQVLRFAVRTASAGLVAIGEARLEPVCRDDEFVREEWNRVQAMVVEDRLDEGREVVAQDAKVRAL